MNKKRLKFDLLLFFWGFLIILNLFSMAASWYILDLTNYWYGAVMLLYCTAGFYFSLPKEEADG
tara:strand:+ start:178 stop:369 length:192 start_codon:yes stop_codon:yes gene_type:complete